MRRGAAFSIWADQPGLKPAQVTMQRIHDICAAIREAQFGQIFQNASLLAKLNKMQKN